jgi:hypothetical protein
LPFVCDVLTRYAEGMFPPELEESLKRVREYSESKEALIK